MVKSDPHNSLGLYAALMEEIKLRLAAIQDAIATAKAESRAERPVANWFLRAEFSILQVRYVCELVALATLAANRPMGLGKRLRQEAWNAGKIFRELSKLNPDCFPRHATINEVDGVWHIVAVKGLKSDDLGRIYDQCGAMLHRGVIQHFFQGRRRSYSLNQIERWATDIGAHLSTHVARIPDKKIMFLVDLSGRENGSCAVAKVRMGSHTLPQPPQE